VKIGSCWCLYLEELIDKYIFLFLSFKYYNYIIILISYVVVIVVSLILIWSINSIKYSGCANLVTQLIEIY